MGCDGCTKILGACVSNNYQCSSCSSADGTTKETVIENRIESRTPYPDNECTKEFSMSANGENIDKCPRVNATDLFGFDVVIDSKIGCNLYTILTLYLELIYRNLMMMYVIM